jgi:hypothetical protein
MADSSFSDFEAERIGQEDENDLKNQNSTDFSETVLWGTDWTTETIITQLKKGNIELNPNFQRRNAWGTERKSAFIESLMLGLPIPQIILAERKEKKGAYIVIDGKQRLLSIRQYSVSDDDDEFEPLKLTGLKILNSINGKTYQEVSNDTSLSEYNNILDNQSIRTVIIKNWNAQEFLYTVFLRLNTGSLPLSPQELRQALNPGPFTTFVDQFSIASPQIRKVLGLEKPDYRMRDVEIVVRYFAFKFFLEEYSGSLKEFLDDSCSKLNKKWGNEETLIRKQAEELNNAIIHTYHIFDKNAFSKFDDDDFTHIFNRPVFDMMTYYFSFTEIRDATNGKEKEILDYFISICKNDIEFRRSIESSTKNTSAIIKRFSEWGKGLMKILNIKVCIPEKTDSGIVLK